MKPSESQSEQFDVAALKSRWNTKDPESGNTLAQDMLQQLQTKCLKNYPERPIRLDLRGITLFNEDLEGLDLSGYDLSYASLNQCYFHGSNFSYSVCHHANFDQAVLDECEFIGSVLQHASMNECSARQCGFGGADLSHASLINANLKDATLSQSTSVHTDFRAADLTRARASEADLSHAIFTRAKLLDSDLKQSNVEGTNFELADMQGCRLLGVVNYKKARWVGADIRGLDLRGAYLVRRFIADENYLYEFKTRSKLNQVIYVVWWATSDCGRSLLRWFVWLLIATLGFAAVYTQVPIDYGDHPTFFSPVYFSFVTLTTLGYGDAVPSTFIGQFFVTLQAISGYMGLGGLLSILGNKMARRAE